MLQNQSNIDAGGHVAGRDVVVTNNNVTTASIKTYIERLYEQYNLEHAGSAAPAASGIHEDLQHFLDCPARQITRSLKEKLIAAGRQDMIDIAEEAKERAVKRIMQFQSSPSAQQIFVYVLGDLRERFRSSVSPLVALGAPRPAIDSAIYSSVVRPVSDVMMPSALNLGPDIVAAFLYYLAGNCHIQWD